ncbi:MAG TPA: outer membrane protein assembly factor BamE [Burkholderiales bacterium]|nr:outer membrane protein assembly factor BamE [Burkholderiales bacterium]
MRIRILLLLVALTLSSCFLKPHKIDIQQGNYIDAETLAKLKPGMTRSQVRFLLGTPLIMDPFHPERWDYMFLDRRAGKLMQERRATLWFDGDKLKRAVTDAEGASTNVGASPKAAKSASANGSKQ